MQRIHNIVIIICYSAFTRKINKEIWRYIMEEDKNLKKLAEMPEEKVAKMLTTLNDSWEASFRPRYGKLTGATNSNLAKLEDDIQTLSADMASAASGSDDKKFARLSKAILPHFESLGFSGQEAENVKDDIGRHRPSTQDVLSNTAAFLKGRDYEGISDKVKNIAKELGVDMKESAEYEGYGKEAINQRTISTRRFP